MQRGRFSPRAISIVAIGTAIIMSSFAFAQVAQRQDTQERKAKTASATSQPFSPRDLSGVWVLKTPFAGISDAPPPFTPAGTVKFMANKPSYGPRAVPPAQGNDVMGNCDPIGFPRNMFSPSRAVQFVQLPNELLQVFQYHSAWRQIWTDGRVLPKDPDLPTLYGYSVGKWDGDAFEVTTVGLNEKTWLDHFGYPHSADMSVDERYRRTDAATFELILTVNDPAIYTKPWVSDKKTFKLAPEQQLSEEYCIPSEEQHFNEMMRDPAGGK